MACQFTSLLQHLLHPPFNDTLHFHVLFEFAFTAAVGGGGMPTTTAAMIFTISHDQWKEWPFAATVAVIDAYRIT